MLEPRPLRGLNFPAPRKLLSKSRLAEAWQDSKDSKRKAAGTGIDGESAKNFAGNLDRNLTNLAYRLGKREFGFSKLKPCLIPKPNSDKDRLICIPTVRDRLIQRAIVSYLVSNQVFPIYNSSSFGFIKGLGTGQAINEVVKARNNYEWILKTDIMSFFDRIPRGYLKDQVKKSLGIHSITPLIWKAIDCEVKADSDQEAQIREMGVRKGEGVRQGMPLSPILSNLERFRA